MLTLAVHACNQPWVSCMCRAKVNGTVYLLCWYCMCSQGGIKMHFLFKYCVTIVLVMIMSCQHDWGKLDMIMHDHFRWAWSPYAKTHKWWSELAVSIQNDWHAHNMMTGTQLVCYILDMIIQVGYDGHGGHGAHDQTWSSPILSL